MICKWIQLKNIVLKLIHHKLNWQNGTVTMDDDDDDNVNDNDTRQAQHSAQSDTDKSDFDRWSRRSILRNFLFQLIGHFSTDVTNTNDNFNNYSTSWILNFMAECQRNGMS